jgi:gliding motility-associated lipoprotein GldK
MTIMLIISSCGGKSADNGQLMGSQNRPKWNNNISPIGMVYIGAGTLHMGQSDQDIFNSYTQRTRAISIPGFFMDDTEITNNEYRQMVDWVKDSIAHTYLEHYYEDEDGNEILDWEYEIDWADENLEDMFVDGDNTLSGRKELNKGLLDYEYRWIDWQRAAHHKTGDVSQYLKKEVVNVYPDTMVWIRDFAYSYNEPWTRNYFWHPSFDDYPVVGVTWKQAKAFTYWRTQLWNSNRRDEPNSEDFRLPTETEWEYAARGGHDYAPYPWGAYYLRNEKGCLLANFKPGRGNYPEDGGMYTVDAYKYFPNDYGLYNMSGNVAEWTESSYEENAYNFVHDLSPDLKYDAKDEDPTAWKRKVVRGGSWKDVAYYLQTGTRHWEYQDTAKSYIGFRCALTFLGRSIKDKY